MANFPIDIDNLQYDYVISIDRLNEMNLNIFDTDLLNGDADNDPDYLMNDALNIDIPSSVYVTSQSFKNSTSNSNLSILNWNIVSVPENLDFFLDLYFPNTMPDIIALCETRLSDEIVNLHGYPNYDMHVTCRHRLGGGVALYMNQRLQSLKLNEFSYLCPDFEIVACEFIENGGKSFIASIYRPPSGDKNVFHEKISELLDEISILNFRNLYIVGDFNVNILDKTNDSQSLINVMISHSLFPFCTKPTRVKDGSATLIDHVWSNNIHQPCHNQIVLDRITDHFPVMTTFFDSENQVHYFLNYVVSLRV